MRRGPLFAREISPAMPRMGAASPDLSIHTKRFSLSCAVFLPTGRGGSV